MALPQSDSEFIDQLRNVLHFLQDHGFSKAADAIYEQLEDKEQRSDSPGEDEYEELEEVDPASPGSAAGHSDQDRDTLGAEQQRSKSAEPLLTRGDDDEEGEEEAAEEQEEGTSDSEEQRQRMREEVLALSRRHSGSQRHYEAPDLDEYDSMDDVGYVRRYIPRQQEFILHQLDTREDEPSSPHAASIEAGSGSHGGHTSGSKYKRSLAGGEHDGDDEDEGRRSEGSAASSSASLEGGLSGGVEDGDGASSGGQQQLASTSATSLRNDNVQQQDQKQQQRGGEPPGAKEAGGQLLAAGDAAVGAVTGDAAWDQGPTDITFAEPVTTPNRGSRRSSASEAKPSLSRVESLSNSFIDDADSVTDCGRLSEAGSLGPAEVIDFAPVPLPDAVEADFGPVFDLKAQRGLVLGGSVTSSMDVMRGSLAGVASEAGSEMSGTEAGIAPRRSSSSGGGLGAGLSVLGRVVAGAASSAVAAAAAAAGVSGAGGEAVVSAELEPSTPTAASKSKEGPSDGVGGFGAGFSFPVTPPTDDEEREVEGRAERVFSTWASSHSRASDDEGLFEGAASSPSSSQPLRKGSGASQHGADEAPAPFGWPKAASSSGAGAGTAAEAGAGAGEGGKPFRHGSLDAAMVAGAVGRRGGAQTGAKSDPGDAQHSPSQAAPSQKRQKQQQQQQQPVEVSPFAQPQAPASDDSSFPAASAAGDAAGATSSPGMPQSAGETAGAAAAGVRGSGRKAKAAAKKQQRQQQQQQQQQEEQPAQQQQEPEEEQPLLQGVQPEEEGEEGAVHDEVEEGHVSDYDGASVDTAGLRSGGETPMPRYVVDEQGNIIYEYDVPYMEARYEVFDLRVVHRRHRTGFEESKDFPIRKNDLIAGRYQVMDFLGSAAFSQAVQALDVATGGLVCLKIIKNNKDYFDQSLDEIKLLRYVNACDPADEHSIVRLYDFFYYKEHLFLVCELLRANLYEFQKYQRDNGDPPYFTLPRIQAIARQVLHSLAFLHSLGLIHSDLKPENILIKSYSRCEVKVIDLGSSCFTSDHLSSYVQSRSYRAPEVILGLRYDQKIDIWSLGCILAELSSGFVLFQNDSLATLLARLEGILGPLPEHMVQEGRFSHRFYTRSGAVYERSPQNKRYEILQPKHTSLRHRVPEADEAFLDFLSFLLTVDPELRPTAEEALQHPWLHYPYPPVEPVQD